MNWLNGNFQEMNRFYLGCGNRNFPEAYFSILIIFFYKFGFWSGRAASWLGKQDHSGIYQVFPYGFCTRSYEVGNWIFSIICATEQPKSAKWRIAPPQAASKVKFDRAFLK